MSVDVLERNGHDPERGVRRLESVRSRVVAVSCSLCGKHGRAAPAKLVL